ncbi:hypothetical protein EON65_56220 [archaeon]|nr:MAG: hypothetical protein EON65_56220 [archaeon]
MEDVRHLAQVLVDIRASMDDLTCTLILNTFLLYDQGCMTVYEFMVRMRYLLMVGIVAVGNVDDNGTSNSEDGAGAGAGMGVFGEIGGGIVLGDWHPVKRDLFRKLCGMLPSSSQAEIRGKYPLL